MILILGSLLPGKTQAQLTKSCQLINHFQDDIIHLDKHLTIQLLQIF